MKPRRIYIFLSLSVLLSVTLAAIPHISSINKDNQLIGADTDSYLKLEKQLMESNNTSQFLHTAFVKIGGGDRPVSLLFFLSLVKVSGGDSLYITDSLPMVLGPLLVLAIFFLTRELIANDLTSIFAAFLTAVSSHSTTTPTTVTTSNNGEFFANFTVPLSSSVGFVQVVATQGSKSASETFIETSSLTAINQSNLSDKMILPESSTISRRLIQSVRRHPPKRNINEA